jgi:hypothetical protein
MVALVPGLFSLLILNVTSSGFHLGPDSSKIFGPEGKYFFSVAVKFSGFGKCAWVLKPKQSIVLTRTGAVLLRCFNIEQIFEQGATCQWHRFFVSLGAVSGSSIQHKSGLSLVSLQDACFSLLPSQFLLLSLPLHWKLKSCVSLDGSPEQAMI